MVTPRVSIKVFQSGVFLKSTKAEHAVCKAQQVVERVKYKRLQIHKSKDMVK